MIDIWTAVQICKQIEPIADRHGFHIGLTGGCLYKEGERKDMDIVLYHNRQSRNTIYENYHAFIAALVTYEEMEVTHVNKSDYPDDELWVTKLKYGNITIDILFPECSIAMEQNRQEERRRFNQQHNRQMAYVNNSLWNDMRIRAEENTIIQDSYTIDMDTVRDRLQEQIQESVESFTVSPNSWADYIRRYGSTTLANAGFDSNGTIRDNPGRIRALLENLNRGL